MSNGLDEEFNRFLQHADEERERRLRAEREAHEPELPAPQWPIGKPHITLWEAARLLLAIVRPPALFAKSSDSGVRSAAIKGVTCGDLVQEILRWAREGRLYLIHPTLVLPMPRHPDPDEDWRIGPGMFEHIKNALANGHEPAIDSGDGAAGNSAPAGDVGPQNAERSDKLEPPTPIPAISRSGEGATAAAKRLPDKDLCEWIFNHDPRNGGGQQLNFSDLLHKARRDPTLRAFTDTAFKTAHQTVYETKGHRRPAGGWPFNESYHSRWAHNNKPENKS
jgi:hypothetical protein